MIRIEPLKPQAAIIDPQLVIFIKIKIADPAVRRAAAVLTFIIVFKTVTVKPVQSILGPKPEKTQAVLGNI